MAARFVSPMIRRRPAERQQPAESEQDSRAPGDVTNSSTSSTTDNVVQNAESLVKSQTETHAKSDAQPNEQPPLTEEPVEQLVRVAFGTYRQARDYSLVLLSQGIVHSFDRSEEGPFEILVDPEHEERALHQIELYRRENPPRKDNPPMPLAVSAQPVWVLLVPVACTLADFGNYIAGIHSKGLSDAYKVLHGEWWRTITALTLHGDSHHLASNLVSGYIVLNLLAYRIPLARMAPFLAASSALANFCVALTVQSDYRALGFSTFVFACIGALSVIEFRLMPRETHGMLRRFAPLCGAISIAVFLGLGEHADILGHGYGFIAGMLCGLIPKKKMLRWGTPTTLKDIVWIVAYFAIFAIGWALALN